MTKTSEPSSQRFVAVDVEPCEVAPDGISLRFMGATSDESARTVQRMLFESDEGVEGWWEAFILERDVPDGGLASLAWDGLGRAQCLRVQDSSAGTSVLIYGGKYGLLLRLSAPVRAPVVFSRVAYLLLAESARVELL